ncbi:double-cubane-cluster-containing anaerobic reductase [Desulfothermobacter acidiphilus]|uniref:double-cubane-cluster-containing anaerobic reductase n=1 Tax=Desulfothermobacter acidiphilus TaxID=1938353 RepID=UPI003F8A1017
MAGYETMWRELGIDLESHDRLLQSLGSLYGEVYLAQSRRPQGMEYFDFVVSEIHGLRVKELNDFRRQGGKVVGTFCIYVPEELVLAAGGVYVGLCAGVEVGTAQAEAVLPRNICPLIKSFMGFKLTRLCPYFESCDLLVGETTCDGKKKTFEILSDYAPVHVMEVPQKKEALDQELWLAEIKKLVARLEELAGKKVTYESLREAIRRLNAKRRALRRLAELRRADPPPISGLDALLIFQIAFYDDVERFTEKVNALGDELEERIRQGVGVVEPGAPRLLVTGTPMAIPNWKLPYLAETSGAVIVAEELCTGQRYFQELTEEEGGSLEELLVNVSRRHLAPHCACFTPNGGRLEDIERLIQEYRVDGVISYVLSFCDPYAVEHYQVEKFLKAQGVPVLKVETDYSMQDAGQLKTRIEAFVEMLRQKT